MSNEVTPTEIETYSPYEQFWEHLKTETGLMRIILNVNAEDHVWFSEPLRRKVCLIFFIRGALDVVFMSRHEENLCLLDTIRITGYGGKNANSK